MSFVRQSVQIKSQFGDPPLPEHSMILFEEEYYQKPIKESNGKKYKQEKSFIQNDDKHILKIPKKKELTHADIIERLIIEASSNKQRRRRPSTLSSNNSYQIDKLLQDENNDWFFEKILEKFENIRSKKAKRYIRSPLNDFDNDIIYGAERIVERRYYVKKPKLGSKRDQLTSTSDLTRYGKKIRQISGVSSIITCSQCSSLTPTYVENLRNQSDSLRNEISELKNEIEQLQTSQQEFFQQLQTQFQSKNFYQPAISPLQTLSEKNQTFGNLPVSLTTGQRSRSTSTQSRASSSTITSRQITSTLESTAKPVAAPLSAPVAPTPQISEFIATKNPSYVPAPPINGYVNSKLPLVARTSPLNGYVGSKPPSVAPISPINGYVGSKPSSVAPISPINGYVGSKPSSVPSTPPISEFIASRKPIIVSEPLVTVPIGPADSRISSVAPTPPIDPSPMPSARIPIYENELAHRRVLSPRSQIVASSIASIQDSSDSSSESISPEFVYSNPQEISRVPVTILHDNDLKDLVQYSSQLELSGFPSSITPLITNPNTSSTFWQSVDQYIENSRLTNIFTGLPPISPSNYGNRFGLNNSTTKQLDKYDLEIKPQGIIESSAPLLMPPLDILP